MMMISVIMPVYNVEKYIERAVESILNQNYKEIEIILINDGSTDSSGEICELLRRKSKNIKVIHQANSGSGAARQAGIALSIGEYICFVDPDDYMEGDNFNNNMTFIEKYQPDLIVNGYFQLKKNKLGQIIKEEVKPSVIGLYSNYEFRDIFHEYIKVNPRSLWNKLYKAKFIKDNNITFEDQKVGQDALFNFSVYKHLKSIYIDDKSYYNYEMLRDNSAVNKYNSRRVKYELNIIDRMSDLIDYWERSKSWKQLLNLQYWNLIIMELLNLNSKSCPLSLNEKNEKLKIILKDTRIVKAIKEIEINEMNRLFQKILLFLLKKQRTKTSLNLMGLYVRIMK